MMLDDLNEVRSTNILTDHDWLLIPEIPWASHKIKIMFHVFQYEDGGWEEFGIFRESLELIRRRQKSDNSHFANRI